MLAAHLKKLLLVIPLLLSVSIVVFFSRYIVPQDPVEQRLGVFHEDRSEPSPYSRDSYVKEAIKLGLHKPKFYFSIKPNFLPKLEEEYLLPREKKLAHQLFKNGNNSKNIYQFIGLINNHSEYKLLLNIADQISKTGSTDIDFTSLNQSEILIIKNLIISPKSNFFYPKFYWHGIDNQYHHWVKEIINNESLRSNYNNSLVIPKIKKSLAWTLLISFLSILITYGFGIIIGYNQVKSDKAVWYKIQSALDIFYTMPLFWIATLAIVFFTTSDYGKWTNIFPAVHSMDFSATSIWSQLSSNFKHLILPVFCVSLRSTGIISSILSSNLRVQLNKPYILTAKQKGLDNHQIIKNHGLRNSLFPILTLFTGAIPSAISGSLVLEIIFNIPGVGRLLYNSILLADWNVVFPIVLLIAIVTTISYWLADILYELFDPRLKTAY